MSVGVRSVVRNGAVLVAIGALSVVDVSSSVARIVTSEGGTGIVKCASAAEIDPPPSPAAGDRVLFDRVWIAGRDHVAAPNARPFGSGPFVYYAKTGFGLRRGRIGALVEVPPAWRDRVRITWGNVASAVGIRFVACQSGPTWTTYAGGFFFRDKRGGCVPLQITVQARTETVFFSAGRRC